MSKKTLYRHFSSKEELLAEVLRHRTQNVRDEIQEVQDSRIPYPEKFRSLLTLMQQRMSEINPIFLSDLQIYAPQCFEIIEEFRECDQWHSPNFLPRNSHTAGSPDGGKIF